MVLESVILLPILCNWQINDKHSLRASISDVFQRSVQDMAHDCGFFYTVQKTRSRSHRLDISISDFWRLAPAGARY